ncbi:2-hydroxyhepta-2,4-diene-1,7-dioate isomerase [archaeon SCG-AAA382B04]|nr:2-hydroxyhepta-2,4-diene-1,7-dioate isomerase [archaeon SCG-AAA382B04]
MSKKIIRFLFNGKPQYGKIVEDKVILDSKEKKIEDLEILPPAVPSKVICVGLNYEDHADELNQELPESPVFFYKPPSSIIGHNDKILLPRDAGRIDYEAELAIVIGERCRNLDKSEVKKKIWGYTCLNDVTARDIQDKERQWVISKGFDSFCPIGPVISKSIPKEAEIKSIKNGEVKQKSDLKNLIFDEKELISRLSQTMTLKKGDIVSTGTPKGVGKLEHGDSIEVKVEGVGTLKNISISE